MPAADLRAQAPGSLDTSFDPGDGANGTVTTTALQADGKILLSGVFSTIDDVGRNGIARLNADGSLDAGFDPGAGVDGQINSVMVQATGQIIITGFSIPWVASPITASRGSTPMAARTPASNRR